MAALTGGIAALDRLLIVMPAPIVGGTERHSMNLARAWARQGCEVRVLADPALLPALAPLADGLPLAGAALAFDPDRPRHATHARQAAAMRQVLLRQRPDAALVTLPFPDAAFGVLHALAEAGVPTLGHAHLVQRDVMLGPEDRSLLAAFVGRVGFAAVSEPAARRLEMLFRLPFGSCAVVVNGLGDPRPTPIDRAAWRAEHGFGPDDALALMVGRLDERKGAHLAPAIARAIAPAKLLLLGDGPLRGQGGPPNMIEIGVVPQPRRWMAAADVLILPSLHEGCPLVVLEAAAEGCPVIATADALEAWPDASAWADIVTRDPSAIAAAFARAGDRRRIGAAQAMARGWDEAAGANRLLALLAAEAWRCAA